MPIEEHDELWELLGRARQPKISPFFARDVLREVRPSGEDQTGLRGWLRRTWRVTVPLGAAAVLLAVSVPFFRPDAADQNALAEQMADDPDYEVIEHLDELIAFENNSIWLDDFSQ